jgi:ribosomal protein L11 methyltransferase
LKLEYTLQKLENKDWNKEWESNFAPILFEPDLYIYADFHPRLSHLKHTIQIAPKMAFGTGHHSTTSLILKWMILNDFQNKSVLDFGSGTGILGIYAYLKGCTDLVMIDNDPNAVENAIEHCYLNSVQAINLLGSVKQIPNRKFDIIFANITRNVLEYSLPDLKNHLHPNGFIIISGFLKSDELYMIQLVKSHGMNIIEINQDLDWLSMILK